MELMEFIDHLVNNCWNLSDSHCGDRLCGELREVALRILHDTRKQIQTDSAEQEYVEELTEAIELLEETN